MCCQEGQLQGLLEVHEAALVFRDIRRQPEIQPWYVIRRLPLAPFLKLGSRKKNEATSTFEKKRDKCRDLNIVFPAERVQ